MKSNLVNLSAQFKMRFAHGSFLRNVSVVMLGSVLGRVFGFVLMPVLSRLYTPSDFGALGAYNAILGIATTVVSFQYAQAIVLPKERQDAAHLFVLAGLTVFVTTGLFSIAAIMLPAIVLPNIYEVSGWFPMLLVLGVFFGGLNQVFEAWCVRIKAFNATATSQLYRSVVNSGISALLGLLAAGPLGLVSGAILGLVFGSLNLVRISASDLRVALATTTWKHLKEVAVKFRDFPMYSAPQNAMNALSQGLPVLILGNYYGSGVAGFYAFGMVTLKVPMDVVLGPLRQVLFQKASEAFNQRKDLLLLYKKSTIGLFSLALIPCLTLFMAAPEIFDFVFGKEWFEAGQYARWLALWVLVGFCNMPSNIFARILRQQKNLFIWECLVLIMRVGTLVLGGLHFHVLSTIIAFSLVGAVLNMMFIFWIGIIINRKTDIVCTE